MSRTDPRLVHQGVSKEKYFKGNFTDRLQELYYKSSELKNPSTAASVFEALFKIGAGLLLGHAAADLAGRREQITLTVGGGLLGAWFAWQGIKKDKEAAAFAENVCILLEKLQNKEESLPENLLKSSPLIDILYQEFRLSIEMLSTQDAGIDLLIKHFMLSILEAVNGHTALQIKAYSPEKCYEIILAILHSKDFFETCRKRGLPSKLSTHDARGKENNWQMDELVLHSPVLIISEILDSTYNFSLQLLSPAMSKTRWGSSVKAEATHKYPMRFIVPNYQRVLQGFVYNQDVHLPVDICRINPDSKLESKREQDYPSLLSSLYWVFSENRRTQESLNPFVLLKDQEQAFQAAADLFKEVAGHLLNFRIISLNKLLYYAQDRQNLRNLYWEELRPQKGKLLKHDNRFWNDLEKCYEGLGFSAAEVSPQRLRTPQPILGVTTPTQLEVLDDQVAEQKISDHEIAREIERLDKEAADLSKYSMADKLAQNRATLFRERRRRQQLSPGVTYSNGR